MIYGPAISASCVHARMPLTKWQVEPCRLLESCAATEQGSELTDFINVMMSCVVRQLGCISSYAEDMFSELAAEANLLTLRANQLNQRVSLLRQYASQLSPADEEEGLFPVVRYTTTLQQQLVLLMLFNLLIVLESPG